MNGGVLLGVYFYKDPLKKEFSTKQEIYEDEVFAKGIFVPKSILYSNGLINVNYADIRYSCRVEALKKGYVVKPHTVSCGPLKEQPFEVKMIIKNDRLFISTVFKDIQKEEVVGIIDYDHWRLFKPNLLNWKESDTSLEALDRGNNVIFNMIYEQPNTLTIHGYSVGLGCIFVVLDDAIYLYDKKDKQGAIADLPKIKRIFLY